MELLTDRLLIRPWRHEDAPRLLDIQSRVEVVKWLGDGPPQPMRDLDEAHARIDRWSTRGLPPLGVWAIERRADGVVVGTVLLVTLPNAEAGEVEIGWHLHPDSWGQGYASEAGRAVLRHGFESGLLEILAVTHLGNVRSQAVMGRIGLAGRGVVEKWYDEPSELYGITAREWRRATAQENRA